MDEHCFSALNKNNALVLTANRRLSNYLHQQYAQYQKKQSKSVWKTPDIFPFLTWQKIIWNKIETKRLLLNNIQEQALWKKISGQGWATIPLIQQAWENLQAWNINLDRIKISSNDSVQHFFQWATQFMSHCQENQWISASEILKHLIQSNQFIEHLPQTIYLSGFDDFSPLMEIFFKYIEKQCNVIKIKFPQEESIIQRVEFDDQLSELSAMAFWAFLEYKQNPEKKIACVIPNLTTLRQQTTRIFNETKRFIFNSTEFDPDKALFNMSTGQSLNDFLMIQTALKIIEGKWDGLLQSSYLTLSLEDPDFSAQADKIRRARNLIDYTELDLLSIFTDLQAHFPQATFLKRWNQLIQFKKLIPLTQSLSQWIHTFANILKILQWPGAQPLDSTEHQLLQRWIKALEELTECDAFYPAINAETALSIVTHHVQQIIFQVKTKNAPIQILGLLETAGLTFDAMWIMGLDNEHWPPSASPNPFLPYVLQMKENMPHATPERELYFTEHLQNRLLKSAKKVFLSSPKKEGDRELSPSPLISQFTLENFLYRSFIEERNRLPSLTKRVNAESGGEILRFARNNDERKNNVTICSYIEDNIGLPLNDVKTVHGGTAVLKYQAICSFKAYATFRLEAEALETPHLGLPPQYRGQLLHQVLELFWKRVQSQERLLAMSEEQVLKIISDTVEEISTSSKFLSNNIFFEIEKKRLKKIIKSWIEIEKNREPFHVIAEETARLMNIGPLTFSGRIDRIDRLQNGAEWIIDYKSSFTSVQDWFSERPSDPQLPIYCVFGKEIPYDGIAYAQIRSDAMKFKGIVSNKTSKDLDKDILPIQFFEHEENIQDWSTLMTHWKINLENLSEAYYRGEAKTHPLEGACDYCELQTLCRMNECQK